MVCVLEEMCSRNGLDKLDRFELFDFSSDFTTDCKLYQSARRRAQEWKEYSPESEIVEDRKNKRIFFTIRSESDTIDQRASSPGGFETDTRAR